MDVIKEIQTNPTNKSLLPDEKMNDVLEKQSPQNHRIPILKKQLKNVKRSSPFGNRQSTQTLTNEFSRLTRTSGFHRLAKNTKPSSTITNSWRNYVTENAYRIEKKPQKLCPIASLVLPRSKKMNIKKEFIGMSSLGKLKPLYSEDYVKNHVENILK